MSPEQAAQLLAELPMFERDGTSIVRGVPTQASNDWLAMNLRRALESIVAAPAAERSKLGLTLRVTCHVEEIGEDDAGRPLVVLGVEGVSVPVHVDSETVLRVAREVPLYCNVPCVAYLGGVAPEGT